MPTKKKAPTDGVEAGVEVNASADGAAGRYEDGVSVRTPDAPEQTAGANDGRSAGTTKEKD